MAVRPLQGLTAAALLAAALLAAALLAAFRETAPGFRCPHCLRCRFGSSLGAPFFDLACARTIGLPAAIVRLGGAVVNGALKMGWRG